TYVAFFRALNVGGHGVVSMLALRRMHEALGLQAVNTYIQTGNVLFTSDEGDALSLACQIEGRCLQEFGFASRVVLRRAVDLEEVITTNPFPSEAEQAPERLVVLFLAAPPVPAAASVLQRLAAAGPEKLQLSARGQELYIWYADGIGRSKLTPAELERALGCPATGRNWRTLLQIRRLLQQRQKGERRSLEKGIIRGSGANSSPAPLVGSKRVRAKQSCGTGRGSSLLAGVAVAGLTPCPGGSAGYSGD
ncbi:MAG: DUF1697 domain-containing protein, partial [Thermogemmatispora sp.]